MCISYISLSFSLSLSLYIYIYIYTCDIGSASELEQNGLGAFQEAVPHQGGPQMQAPAATTC